ncbi:large subunit ribosomal protein L25 [Gracilibacillus halotolerans]|uniref:Large ribosomal subunit protein bL25 n=1 Tax=Gracilibacillus halotolerans TaxID=74386 RepID=A0A841RMF0_9BACI|nr:large subunit ribosomal protein L25 [Gracilibacillus halotolerans]
MSIALEVQAREDLQKSQTKLLRSKGEIPAVLYGYNIEPITIAVNEIELIKTVRDEGRNAIISLNIDGESYNVMLHEYQIDPIRGDLIHADFLAVDMSEELEVNVSIVLEGDAIGVKEGGVLQQPLYELLVRAKPNEIPEQINVDVSNLNIGESILVSDIKAASNYEIVEEETTAIATILVPDEVSDEPAEDSETAEPEVINEKKEEA